MRSLTFFLILSLVIFPLSIRAAASGAQEAWTEPEWAKPLKACIEEFTPGKPYVAYYFSHPGEPGTPFVASVIDGMDGSLMWAICSDKEVIEVGDTVEIWMSSYQGAPTQWWDGWERFTRVGAGTVKITKILQHRDDDRTGFDTSLSYMQGFIRADYYLDDMSSAYLSNTYAPEFAGSVLQLWTEPEETNDYLTPHTFSPVLDSILKYIAIILPVGIALFALILSFPILLRILKRFAG